MATLNFKSVLGPIKMSLLSGAVPIILGERGIGKTSIARKIASDFNMNFVSIDGNLLKEGEIGGLPTTKVIGEGDEDFLKYANSVYKKSKQVGKEKDTQLFQMLMTKLEEVNKEDRSRTVTVYATHHLLEKVLMLYKQDPNKKTLLFIDEINRCEHAVQQELMNLILNREINGFELPPNTVLMAAANPSNKFAEFKNTDYQTVDMDAAQEDRLRWFFVGSDEKVWLDWASTIIDEKTGETIVHPDICEYIASNPDVLNQPQSNDDIKPSPRSWHRLSESYKIYKSEGKGFTKNDLYNVARGDLGPTVALQFTQFLNENANPLLKPEDIFENLKGDTLTDSIRNRIKSESFPRMMMIIKNCARYLMNGTNGAKKSARNLKLYIETVVLLPKDLMVMIMMNTLNEHKEFHNKLVAFDEYLDAFHNVDQLVD